MTRPERSGKASNEQSFFAEGRGALSKQWIISLLSRTHLRFAPALTCAWLRSGGEVEIPSPWHCRRPRRLLRQKLNRAFAQTDGIALVLLGELDDLLGDDLGCGVGSIGQAQRAQGVFERGGEDRDLVRSKHMIFQQATDRHGHGSRCVCSFCRTGAGSLPHHRLAPEADDGREINGNPIWPSVRLPT